MCTVCCLIYLFCCKNKARAMIILFFSSSKQKIQTIEHISNSTKSLFRLEQFANVMCCIYSLLSFGGHLEDDGTGSVCPKFSSLLQVFWPTYAIQSGVLSFLIAWCHLGLIFGTKTHLCWTMYAIQSGDLSFLIAWRHLGLIFWTKFLFFDPHMQLEFSPAIFRFS